MTIVTIRKNNGLTQLQLASKLDLRQSTVSMWETGKSRPNLDTVLKLASIFNCSTDDILNCFNKKAAE